MSPGRLRHRANRAAVAAFLVAALAVGYVLGVQSTQVDDGDLLVGRRQAYDRQQCLVDYLSLSRCAWPAILPPDCHRRTRLSPPHGLHTDPESPRMQGMQGPQPP